MSVELRRTDRETPLSLPFKISRRRFLQLGIALAYLAVAGSIPALLHTSPKDSWENPWKKDYSIYPGWVEDNVSAPLIQVRKGHLYWQNQAVFNNRLVKALTGDTFQFLIEKRDGSNTKLDLGDIFFHTIKAATQKLDQVDKAKINPETDMELEAVHLGSISFAAALNPWHEPEEMAALGASIAGYKSVAEYYWNTQRGLAKVLPRLFGLDLNKLKENKNLIKPDEEPRITGEDRCVHFAQYFLLTFENLYSSKYHLPDHENIPQLLKLPMGLARSAQDKARTFALMTGILYEYYGLLDLKNWPIGRNWEEIGEGIFDFTVEADYSGNALGAETAIAMWRKFSAGESIDSVIHELNDPKFSHLETPATLAG